MYAINDYETGDKIKGGFSDELEAEWYIESHFIRDCYVSIEREKMILEMEHEIMDKYGYNIHDFEEWDNRDLFDCKRDSERFTRILDKYFAKPIQHKIMADIERYDRKVDEYGKILYSLDKFLGFDFGDHFYIDLLEFLDKKRKEVGVR